VEYRERTDRLNEWRYSNLFVTFARENPIFVTHCIQAQMRERGSEVAI